MIDIIAHSFLYFSQLNWICFCVIFGYLFIHKKLYYHAFILALWSILWNVTLKVTFKVPLAAFLMKEGFAFPSGHMQLVLVFYGWIFLHIKNSVLKGAIIVLLLGIAWALIHFNYHTFYDVVGACISGPILIGAYQLLLKQSEKKQLILIGTSCSIMALYIHYSFRIETHVWVALGGLLITSFYYSFTKKEHKTVPY